MKPIARLSFCLLMAPAAWANAGLVPLELFFQNPAISGARLSDDGRCLVMRVSHESGRMSVGRIDFETRRASLVVVPGDYDVDYVLWKDNLILFGGDAGGNESYSLRSIKPDGTGWKDLNESYDPLRPIEGPVMANTVSMLRSDPGHILTQGYGARRTSEGRMEPEDVYGLYRLNVRTGRRTLVEAIPDKVVVYYTDAVTGLPYGRLMQQGADTVLELRAPGEKEYVFTARFPGGEEYLTPIGLMPDGDRCLVLIRGGEGFDRATLAEFDLRTGKRLRIAYSPPEGEVTDVIRSKRGKLWGVAVEAERARFVWFDPDMGRLHASLQATFPDQLVELVDSSLDENVLLFIVHSDRDPGTYYLWNREKPGLLALGKVLPRIDPKQMAERTPISYTARDGLRIHGYLTRPPGDKGKRLPMILLPHGGPYGPRDSWSFDSEAQFLANRGYVVLQVNFRGSGGYGYEFQQAGRKQWGGKMQDDLTDAVRWAIAEKITTADNVAIMGASYGGYAALAGLVFTPELYRCGINAVGVSDLRFLSKSTTWKGRGYRLFTAAWIGDDTKYLEEHSPVNYVERIRVPTLHAYGPAAPSPSPTPTSRPTIPSAA
ncbi:MAG: S9 family peptidase [Opitutae bacterium]|nr:S9 family peptidase [Opitutae bacterium]